MLETYCYVITPKDGFDESEFENFIKNEIFPELQVFQRNVRGTSHSLLKGKTPDGNVNYIWKMQVDFISVGSASRFDFSDSVNEKIKDFGSVSDSYCEV